MPVDDEKYIKVKAREFNGVIKTNFLGDKMPKENVHYTCIACITTDSVMKIERKKKIHRLVQKNANTKKRKQRHLSL